MQLKKVFFSFALIFLMVFVYAPDIELEKKDVTVLETKGITDFIVKQSSKNCIVLKKTGIINSTVCYPTTKIVVETKQIDCRIPSEYEINPPPCPYSTTYTIVDLSPSELEAEKNAAIKNKLELISKGITMRKEKASIVQADLNMVIKEK